jgi:large repetitive protein
MRHFRAILILALLCLAALTLLVPGASAGIRDEPCPTVSGENTNTCPTAQVGVPYSLKFRAVEEPPCSPGDDTWTVSSGAPPGLSMSSDGTLSGTPTQTGVFTFYVEMHLPNYPGCNGSRDSSEKKFTIPVGSRMIVSTASLPDGSINQPYSAQLSASGGNVSSWSLAAGALPDGLTLASNGVIAGTPTKSGSFTFRVQANASSNSDTKQLSIFIVAPLVLGGPGGQAVTAEPVAVNGKVNAPLVWSIGATGGRGGYTYTSTPLPAGLTLGTDGKLTGIPTSAGSSLVTFTVKDAAGGTDTLRARITIQALLAFAPKAKAPPAGRVGAPYRLVFKTTGASKVRTFVMSGRFPPGLDLDEATGVLSGTPLKRGTYRIKIWVLGDPGTVITKGFTIRIR